MDEASIPPAGVDEPSKYRAEDIMLNWNHWEEMQRRGVRGLVFHYALPKDVRAHGSRGNTKGRRRGKKYVEIENDEDEEEEEDEDEDEDEDEEEDTDKQQRADERTRQREKGKGKARENGSDFESQSSSWGKKDWLRDEPGKKAKLINQAGGTSGQSTSRLPYSPSKSRETDSDDSMEVDRNLDWDMELYKEDDALDRGPSKLRSLVDYESEVLSEGPTPHHPISKRQGISRYVPAYPSPLHTNRPVAGDATEDSSASSSMNRPASLGTDGLTLLQMSQPTEDSDTVALSVADGVTSPQMLKSTTNLMKAASSGTDGAIPPQMSKPTADSLTVAQSGEAEPLVLQAFQLNADKSAPTSSDDATISAFATPAGHSANVEFMLKYLRGLSSEAQYQMLYAALHKVSTSVHSRLSFLIS